MIYKSSENLHHSLYFPDSKTLIRTICSFVVLSAHEKIKPRKGSSREISSSIYVTVFSMACIEIVMKHFLIVYINSSRHLARKYARIFVRGHYLLREANSLPRTKLEENCELRGSDNVQGQISEHIFAPNGSYCLYCPSNLFRNARSFESWGIFSDIPQF